MLWLYSLELLTTLFNYLSGYEVKLILLNLLITADDFLSIKMINSIGQNCYQQNETTVIYTDQSGLNITNPGIHADNQKQDAPVSQTEPVNSIMAPRGNALTTKPSKSLSEYIAQHCHSFRNLVAAPQPDESLPGVSLSPENLLNAAQQRLLSVTELNKMQNYTGQQNHINVNGKRFELETLPDDTPFFYQFYCLNQKACIDDESMRIFRNNCTIEKSRPAIILINKELINDKVTEQVAQLEKEFEYVHVIDMSFLLGIYDVSGISITQSRTRDGQFYLTVNGERCTLANESFSNGSERVYNSNSDVLDVFQFMSMYHCDVISELAGVKGRGCLKIDWDMELKKPLGSLKCPNGFSAFVLDRVYRKSGTSNNQLFHTLNVENSLVAVTRPRHTILAKSVCPHPRSIFRNFTIAIRKSFDQPAPLSTYYDVKQVNLTGDETNLLKMLCKLENREEIAGQIDTSQQLSIGFNTCSSWKQIVAIPLNGIKADQSRVRGVSSWQDKEVPGPDFQLSAL